ncbi:hypothetical protein HY58_16125 [Flavihumibacter sp. ZG627]|nr:hypothetical protein HY58_16125 [Flavihumibacter sp. ZG627]
MVLGMEPGTLYFLRVPAAGNLLFRLQDFLTIRKWDRTLYALDGCVFLPEFDYTKGFYTLVV